MKTYEEFREKYGRFPSPEEAKELKLVADIFDVTDLDEKSKARVADFIADLRDDKKRNYTSRRNDVNGSSKNLDR